MLLVTGRPYSFHVVEFKLYIKNIFITFYFMGDLLVLFMAGVLRCKDNCLFLDVL